MFRARGVPADEARDLVQDTILRTLVHLQRHGSTRDDLRPLVHTIGRNLAIERARRRCAPTVPLEDGLEVADDGPEPVDEILSRERLEAIKSALASLTPRHRRVVTLWMKGLSPAEIARELGIKRNAADALLHRARRRMASRLAPHSLAGLAGLGWLRIKSAMRRGAEVIGGMNPTSTALAPAGASLAAIGIAALLFVGQPGSSPTSDGHASAQRQASEVHSSSRAPTFPATPVAVVRPNELVDGPAASIDIRAGRHAVGIEADGPGNNDEVEVGIVHRPEADRGLAGPVLDAATNTACSGTLIGCEESE